MFAAPMESFDAALALISEIVGFQDVGYTKLNEGAKRDMWSMYKANLSATDNRRMSEYGRGWEPRADTELVQAVQSFASIDMRMYAHAVRAFDKKVRRLRRDARLVHVLCCFALIAQVVTGSESRLQISSATCESASKDCS